MPMTVKDFELQTELIDILEDVKNVLRRHFEIKDWQGIDIILAAACAHYLPGEMLWVRIVGPSRSGKTELLRAIAAHPDCAEIEAVTPASLRGGFKGAPKVLDRINGRLVICKDIAAILTSRKEMRNEVFGLLRGVKDGKLTADFGSDEGHLCQKASFDWLLATTPYIEQQRQLEGLLGERFLDIRWRTGDREEMAYRAANNNASLDIIRGNLAVEVLSLMDRAKELEQEDDYSLPETTLRYIAKVANAVAIARTPVQQDRQGHLIAVPCPEVGTDIAQGISRITGALTLIGLTDYKAYVKRIAWDCIPSIRVKLLQSLQDKPKNVTDLAADVEIPQTSVSYHIQQLELLKAVKDVQGLKEIVIDLP